MPMQSTFYPIRAYQAAMFWPTKVTTAIKFWNSFMSMMPGPPFLQEQIVQSSGFVIGGYTKRGILWSVFFRNSRIFAESLPDMTSWLIPSLALFVSPPSAF